jgi:hypothetical protein
MGNVKDGFEGISQAALQVTLSRSAARRGRSRLEISDIPTHLELAALLKLVHRRLTS